MLKLNCTRHSIRAVLLLLLVYFWFSKYKLSLINLKESTSWLNRNGATSFFIKINWTFFNFFCRQTTTSLYKTKVVCFWMSFWVVTFEWAEHIILYYYLQLHTTPDHCSKSKLRLRLRLGLGVITVSGSVAWSGLGFNGPHSACHSAESLFGRLWTLKPGVLR